MADAVRGTARLMSASWYRFEQGLSMTNPGTHVYGCGACSFKRAYPADRSNHRKLGPRAVELHVKACHPGQKYQPPKQVTEEAERVFLHAIGEAIQKARDGGVHPGDIMAALDAGFCVAAHTFELDENRALTYVMIGPVACLDHLHWLGEMDADEVIYMVTKLAEVAKHLRDRREGKVPA